MKLTDAAVILAGGYVGIKAYKDYKGLTGLLPGDDFWGFLRPGDDPPDDEPIPDPVPDPVDDLVDLIDDLVDVIVSPEPGATFQAYDISINWRMTFQGYEYMILGFVPGSSYTQANVYVFGLIPENVVVTVGSDSWAYSSSTPLAFKIPQVAGYTFDITVGVV